MKSQKAINGVEKLMTFTEPPSQQDGVQSVEVGLRLIKPLVDAGRSLSLTAIAGATGLAPPKAHRYLVSLVRSGLVERDPESGYYTLGPLALEVGFAALGMIDTEKRGRRAISGLALETDVTCCIAAWINETVLVTAVEVGVGTIFTGVRVGARLSLLGSASGRALLAHLPPGATAHALAMEVKERRIAKHEIEQLLSQIRREGVASVQELVMPGMSGLAAPVFDHDGHPAFTITMLGQAGRFDFSADGLLAKAAKSAASDLSAQLGYRSTGRK